MDAPTQLLNTIIMSGVNVRVATVLNDIRKDLNVKHYNCRAIIRPLYVLLVLLDNRGYREYISAYTRKQLVSLFNLLCACAQQSLLLKYNGETLYLTIDSMEGVAIFNGTDFTFSSVADLIQYLKQLVKED